MTESRTTSQDHSQCAETLRAKSAEFGTEINVSTAPPLVAGPYPTGTFTCPHGKTFYIEPTGEQIAAWARDGTP